MEITGLTCRGCGSSDVTFDPVTRKIHCNQCGKEEFYSRAQLGASGKIILTKDNAVKFFMSGNFQNAREFANDVLNIMQDNAAALFIVAYTDVFLYGHTGALNRFFEKIEPVALEYDEVRDLIKLFEHGLHNMVDYEEQMVTLIIKNMQSSDDRNELEQFIDAVCPYCISRYPSSDFLTESRAVFYGDIASHCNIPKTCFALLKGIKTNPDSPYMTNSFYMKAKTNYFRDHFLEPVGQIIQSMKDSPYKQKFISAFKTAESQFDEASNNC